MTDKIGPTLQLRIQTSSALYFASAEEAARAYDVAAIEHHGHFARLNFPIEEP